MKFGTCVLVLCLAIVLGGLQAVANNASKILRANNKIYKLLPWNNYPVNASNVRTSLQLDKFKKKCKDDPGSNVSSYEPLTIANDWEFENLQKKLMVLRESYGIWLTVKEVGEEVRWTDGRSPIKESFWSSNSPGKKCMADPKVDSRPTYYVCVHFEESTGRHMLYHPDEGHCVGMHYVAVCQREDECVSANNKCNSTQYCQSASQSCEEMPIGLGIREEQLKCTGGLDLDMGTHDMIYAWYKNDELFNSTENDNLVLNIPDAESSQVRHYQCQVINSVAESRKSEHLRVQEKKRRVKPSISVPQISVPINTSISLYCNIDYNGEIEKYEWKKDNDPLDTNSSVHQIKSFQLNHAGSYTCKGYKERFVIEEKSDPVILQPLIPPPKLTGIDIVAEELDERRLVIRSVSMDMSCSPQLGEPFHCRQSDASEANLTDTATRKTPWTNGNVSETNKSKPTAFFRCKPGSFKGSCHYKDMTTERDMNVTKFVWCRCGLPLNLSEAKLNEWKDELAKNLSIDKKYLSSATRKTTSAPDTRASSVSAGAIAITFLCFVFGIIAISDAITLLNFLRRRFKKRQVKSDLEEELNVGNQVAGEREVNERTKIE